MASIRPHRAANGVVTYRVLWRQDGRQRGLTFTDLTSAERHRGNIERIGASAALDMLGIADSGELTLREWLDDHVANLPGIIEGTRRQYRRYVAHDLADLGRLPLAAVTEAAVAQWLQGMEQPVGADGKPGKRPSSKTLQNKHAFLSGAMKAAVRAGKIDRNPCDGQRIMRSERREMVMLTRAEFDKVHATIGRELWADLALWLVSTGMRFGEATALAPSAIDLDEGTCRITRAWKRGKDGWEIGPPKSRRSVRTINLPPQAVDIARRRIADGGDLVFVVSTGARCRQQNFFNEGWAPARGVLGTDRVPRIHDLRHTCASWMIGAGVPLVVVSRHLGHEDITTTANVYGHVDRESGAAAAAAIGRVLG
ncbi:site-specific integrase [Gordonia spumicola]|uniref:Site-specific integrase n=1 Tax=Gordonia spumicola TaxID=589161 RepID=A0A7I9V4R0_9ACTN|nr:site-specific integrase [Gordonia spumicola]GEE00164.1 site-specific integrase [Gordonia spumicola]